MGISYKHFLYGAVTFTSLLAALLKVGLFGTAIGGFRAFFFTMLYFAFLAWAIGELWKIHSRKRLKAESANDDGAGLALLEEDRPSEDALVAAETYLSLGEELDTVCMFVNPKYRGWDISRRQAFRRGLN